MRSIGTPADTTRKGTRLLARSPSRIEPAPPPAAPRPQDWKKIADFKSDGSPLTMADKKANDVICAALTKAYPKIPIISEENKLEAYAKRKEWKYFWCVDPLDGTKEFIKRNGQVRCFRSSSSSAQHAPPPGDQPRRDDRLMLLMF
jgi:hypothetical protein